MGTSEMSEANTETCALIADALALSDQPAFSVHTEVEELPGIDSLKHMRLIAAIEQKIGGKLEIDELLEMDTVADIEALLRRA